MRPQRLQLRKDIGKLSKRKLLELIFSMEAEILAQIGAIKQQLDILANQQFLQASIEEKET